MSSNSEKYLLFFALFVIRNAHHGKGMKRWFLPSDVCLYQHIDIIE